MANIENTITPDSTLEKTNKRISGFDINSTLYEATQNKFKLCNGEEKDNDTILHFTKDNFVTLNGRLYGTGGGFYYLNPLYEKMNNGKKLTNESDADNFVITYGFDGKLTHVYYTTSDNKTVFIDTLKKSNNEIFQIKTTNDGTRYYRTITSSSSTNIPWEIESYQRIHKELGNFETEQEALDALAKVEICGNKDIVHIHLTYGDYDTIICFQSINANHCRQIIYNKTRIFQRDIIFKDSTRTQISYKEDWSFLFGDRLKWDCSTNQYILSQFGYTFNYNYTDPIPTVTTNNDGLMSKSDKVKLDTLSTPSIVTSSKNGLMPYTLYNSIYQPCTSSNPGYMESWQYNHLEEAYINSANAYDLINTTLIPNVEYIMSSVLPLTFNLSAKVYYIETTTIPSIEAEINILSSSISQNSLRPLKIVGIENYVEVSTDEPGDFGRYESAPQLGNFKKYCTYGNNPLIEFTKLTGEKNDYCYFCSFDICDGNVGNNTNYRIAFSHNGNIGFTYGTYLEHWHKWNLLATQSYVHTAYNKLFRYTKNLESKISYITNWIIKLHK